MTLDWQLMVLPLNCGEKKMLKNKKGKKLSYKGLIVVISGIDSLEVVSRCVTSSRVSHLSQRRGVPPCQDEGHWQRGVMESGLLWEEQIPHYGLNGMG